MLICSVSRHGGLTLLATLQLAARVAVDLGRAIQPLNYRRRQSQIRARQREPRTPSRPPLRRGRPTYRLRVVRIVMSPRRNRRRKIPSSIHPTSTLSRIRAMSCRLGILIANLAQVTSVSPIYLVSKLYFHRTSMQSLQY